MGLVDEIRWVDPGAVVRVAVWSLLPLASACREDPLEEWLVDGCWDRSVSEDYEAPERDWEPFACELPIVCEPIRIDLGPGEELEPDEAAVVDASARCMLEAMRDGTPAVHTISSSPYGGQYFDFMAYHVLADGVVGTDEWGEDLSSGTAEVYRRTHDDAFFDECLTQNEYPLGCLLGSAFPPLDREACIDDVPRCSD
jgi:hypothetical protein